MMEFKFLIVLLALFSSVASTLHLISAISLMRCSQNGFNVYFFKGDQRLLVITGRRKIALHFHGYKYQMDHLKADWSLSLLAIIFRCLEPLEFM